MQHLILSTPTVASALLAPRYPVDLPRMRNAIALSFAVGCTVLAVVIGRPPRPLPNRLAKIPEDDPAVSIDNSMYDDDDFGWDDPDHPLLAVNAARCPYFIKQVRRQLGPGEHKLLDVGCGGGFVTVPMAEAGFDVTGIDVSQTSVMRAQRAASAKPSLKLRHQVASLYELPFPDGSFDVVLSSDVLEHLFDLPKAFDEISRVLRPGGIFVFDTINRSLFSYAFIIRLAQDVARYVPEAAHSWLLFVTPEEARAGLRSAGLTMCATAEVTGMRPGLRTPLEIARRLSKRRLLDAILGPWSQTYSHAGSYLAYAIKDGPNPQKSSSVA